LNIINQINEALSKSSEIANLDILLKVIKKVEASAKRHYSSYLKTFF